jgi:hypothetical protein
MKNILIAVVLILFVKTASAQKDSLAFDENNKYIYYQTVAQAGLSADTLYTRALYFLKTAYPKGKITVTSADKAAGVLTAKGSFMVSKKSFISNHEDGEITYTERIEVKDSKYRYWFTNFVYTPYERDRFNSYVPVSGIDIPMENAKDKLDAKDVAGYLDKMLTNSQKTGKYLKSYMLKISSLPKEPGIKKISTKEW